LDISPAPLKSSYFGVRERRGTQHHAVILLNTDNAPYLKVKKHLRGDLKDEN